MAVLPSTGFPCIPKLQAEKDESATNLHRPKDIAALDTNCLHMLTWHLKIIVMNSIKLLLLISFQHVEASPKVGKKSGKKCICHSEGTKREHSKLEPKECMV